MATTPSAACACSRARRSPTPRATANARARAEPSRQARWRPTHDLLLHHRGERVMSQAPIADSGKVQLQGGLHQRHLTMIALGGVIGAGLFVGTGAVISQTG